MVNLLLIVLLLIGGVFGVAVANENITLNDIANLEVHTIFKDTRMEFIESEVESKATTGCTIIYDDDEWDGAYWMNPDVGLAVHFTNKCPSSMTKLKTAIFYIPDGLGATFKWKVLTWTGTKPGSVIASGTTTPTKTGWHDVDVSGFGITVPEDEDFVIAIYWIENEPGPYLGFDLDEPINVRSFLYDPDEEEWIGPFIDIDFMIRAVMDPDSDEPELCTTPDPPSHVFGDVPEGQTRTWTFDIKNCGAGTLTWSISDDQPWITVNPSSGSTTTETDHVTVTIDTTGLSPGGHTGTISITSNGGNKDGTIEVNVITVPTGTVVSIDDAGAAPCNTTTVPIRITNVTDLGAANIWLSYEGSEVVNVTDVSDGDMGSITYSIDNVAGVTKMNWFSATGKTGDFVFAYVTLHAVGNIGETSPLDLDVKELADTSNNPINHTVEDGTFTVGPQLMEGDVTMDMHVTMADAMFIAQYKAGVRSLNASQLKCADTTDEGDVTMADAMHIAQWKADPDGSLGVLFKPLWEAGPDADMLPPVDS
ncbi:hypothetical protein KAW18_08095 [candidate division WOR-3 bacterium]|nr:hypothetical protein [candidate division WOR-3 bacterium]